MCETEKREREETEKQSLCVVQLEGFYLVQHHFIKLCQRDVETAGEAEKKNETGHRRSLFFHLPPSYYSFHLNRLNKDLSEQPAQSHFPAQYS